MNSQAAPTTFGQLSTTVHTGPWTGTVQSARPRSSMASNNTYTMPTSPSKRLRPGMSSYKPSIAKTCGQRPACLVNASVTYCGNDTIFAFGGFDQYTDEVYNHVLKLDLRSLQWSLVDNYGDIPGVRMGHTACLWHDSKLLVYGGENEHRELLSDVIIYDLKTSHWTQPEIRGPIPKGRARHATAVYDDKLYVVGGVTGTDTYTCDEILYLDLKTWTWSRSWSFVARYDHSAWVWGGRIWVFGGLGPDMERTGDLWWLDLKSSPAFKSAPSTGSADLPQTERGGHHGRLNAHLTHREAATGSTGYAANSSSVQVRGSLVGPKSMAPGSMATVRFMSGPDIPAPAAGTHFHAYSSGALLDFTTPAGMLRPWECNLTALDLKSLQWQKLASGSEVFDPSYRWHYCAVNEDGTKAWLLGCAVEANEEGIGGIGEYLSDVLPLDLRRFGLLGNEAAARSGSDQVDMPASDTHATSNLTSLGVDLSAMFDQKKDSGWDFVVTASRDEADDGTSAASSPTVERAPTMPFMDENPGTSPPIHVHRLILQARWPHFKRLYNSEMAEFQTKKLHVPEPYSVVRAFLYYLYTDSIGQHAEYCKDLDDVAGLLVMAQMYDMQRLRLLCLNRLSRELDVEHAAVIWERAGSAQDEWLQKRAANYCLTYWGRVVRTEGFRQLSRRSMMELCEAIDLEGRVVGGEELEMIGGLGGSKLSMGGVSHEGARRRTISQSGTMGDDENEGQEDEDHNSPPFSPTTSTTTNPPLAPKWISREHSGADSNWSELASTTSRTPLNTEETANIGSRGHEARASLLGGQPINRGYAYHAGGGQARVATSKMYKPTSTWTWAFVGVTGVQAAIIIAFQSYVFALFQEGLHRHEETSENAKKDYEQTIPTFLTLYIFGLIYELVLVWDALRLKNTIQIIGLCIYNLGLVIYAAVQLSEIDKAIGFFKKLPSLDPHFPHAIDPSVWPSAKPFLIAIPIIIAIGTLAMGFIARKLYDEFAWTIYKHISADLRMKRRYLTYQIYIAFLKFDFFFFLGFTIQLIVIVQAAHQKDYEFYLTIAAIPVTIGILLLAGIVTRKESKVGTGAIIFLYFAGLAYFIFKCVRMYGHGTKAREYLPAKQSLTTFAVLTIACLVATIVNAFACLLNYDHGLRPYIAHRKVESEDEKPIGNGSQMEMPHLNYASGPATTRMEID